MQHTSLNKCIVSIIIIYTWEYNYQCINITNHLFIIEKPPLYHLWVEGNMCLPPTSVKQYTTITRDLAMSHLASQQLLYDVFMPTKFTPHYSGHIITLWRYM